MPTEVIDATIQPLGYEQDLDMAVAQGLPNIPVGAHTALIQAEVADIRWRDDGTVPTAAIGMLLEFGVPFRYTGDLHAMKIIETGATAVLNVSYYGK